MTDREFIIRLRAPKGLAGDVIVRNLRKILKRLLRTYGWHCVTCEPAKEVPNVGRDTARSSHHGETEGS